MANTVTPTKFVVEIPKEILLIPKKLLLRKVTVSFLNTKKSQKVCSLAVPRGPIMDWEKNEHLGFRLVDV